MIAVVLAWMLALAPARDHAELGAAIADVVYDAPPLFAGDDGRIRTAALVVAVAFRESTFRNDAVGDHGRSFCAMQVHRSSGGSSALTEDAHACVRRGLELLRESLTVCRRLPVDERLALYARGSCQSERGRQLSRDRMRLAKRIAGAR